MRKLFSILFLVMMAFSSAFAYDFTNETINYKIDYKWGLVNKNAGSITVKLNNKGDKYICSLAAKTAPWADKFYKVRDTMYCEVIKNGFKPTFYEIRSHESNDVKHESVTYKYANGTVFGECMRKHWEKGKLELEDTRTLEAQGTTVDMLSAFYFMRHIPYDTWRKDQVLSVNIFSGKHKELLTIKYKGIETITYDKKTFECYHITFIFTANGKKKTSNDIDAWICTSGNHIPVKIEGALPIGKVRCFYTGN